jgi:lipoate-protein ligase B
VGPQSIFDDYVTESNDCLAVWEGCVQYSQALDLQMKICELKRRGFDKDVLLLLEHPPTITLGRSAKSEHLLVNKQDLESRGIGLWNADRGGDITFHGPGQLVGYPILSLKARERDVHRYMRNLEESLIRLLARYEIQGMRDPRFTGVWTQKGKIAAMGVHISRWVTRHGFALNVSTNLSFYDLIVPCGIIGKRVTSMQQHLANSVDTGEVARKYIAEFGSLFNRNMIGTSEDALRSELRHYEDAAGDARPSKPPNFSPV